jgi:hypothetical protein
MMILVNTLERSGDIVSQPVSLTDVSQRKTNAWGQENMITAKLNLLKMNIYHLGQELKLHVYFHSNVHSTMKNYIIPAQDRIESIRMEFWNPYLGVLHQSTIIELRL